MNWSDYPNFTKAEFDCKHTGFNEMKPEFMKLLQALRLMYGKPMTITSGYRHHTHPVEARKGHTTGEHTLGVCCDIACSGADRYHIIRLALKLGFPRIGIAKKFIHLGIGGAGLPSPTIWDYS
jgi:zinc D-Ala-D-Ala carboxypeptidase